MLLTGVYNHRSFSWSFVVFNVIALLVIKFALSPATFKLATLLDATPAFSSREIVEATNTARLANGLPSLTPNYKLDLAAQNKLEDMATVEYFAHISPSGVTPWFWMKEVQYKYIVAGENLAIGFFRAQDTVNAWMDSPSHRANILASGYNDIGVAVSVVEIDDEQGILIVQMFGASNEPIPATSVEQNQASVPTPLISRSPQPTPSGVSAGATEVEPPGPTEIPIPGQDSSVALNYISTDSNIPPTSGIIQAQTEDSSDLGVVSDIADNFYFWYAFILAIMSIVIAGLINRTRHNVLKAAIHTAIFIGAMFIPALSPVLSAFIF